jgi:hypothetical protein
MGLPRIERPRFPIIIPSTGEKTFFVPFSVKEEKILLIAQESQDLDQIILAIKQILENCVEGFDSKNQPMFDLEYCLLKVRSKSVGELIPFEIEDPDTGEKVQLEFDIEKVQIVKNKNHSNVVTLNDTYSLVMKYPTLDSMLLLADEKTDSTTSAFDIMISCIEALVETESGESYKFADFSKKEIDEFIDSLDSKSIKKIKSFFDTIPKIRFETSYKNKEGKQKTYVVEGLQSFFI